MANEGLAHATAIHHIRLTVTDIHRSKAFYQQLLGVEPAFDFSDKVDEPGVKEDQTQFYGGTGFTVGEQLIGLRPVAEAGDTFDSTRVGLDHLGFLLGSTDELRSVERRLTEAGIQHGEYQELGDAGMAIVSVQDPDDINIEFMAAI